MTLLVLNSDIQKAANPTKVFHRLSITEGPIYNYTVQFLLTIIACDLLTIQLRHESYRLNPTYDNSTAVVHNAKNVVPF